MLQLGDELYVTVQCLSKLSFSSRQSKIVSLAPDCFKDETTHQVTFTILGHYLQDPNLKAFPSIALELLGDFQVSAPDLYFSAH